MKSKRISTITWHDGYREVLGRGWAGDHRYVTRKLSDAKANGEMLANAHVIRLPRRCVQDCWGRVYLSRGEYNAHCTATIRDAMSHDRSIC